MGAWALPAADACALDGSGACLAVKVIGEPGKPYVRFDDGVLAARIWRPYTGTQPETAATAKGSL